MKRRTFHSQGRRREARLVLILSAIVCAGSVLASPSSALREYKAGNYDQAVKEYEQLLKRNSDDPRLHFNAGAAAYRNRQFDEAIKQFNDALATPDLNLQELSFYNRGNSLFWLGEGSPDPKKRTEAWEKALKDFELSTKLNPRDTDAKYNHEFVKKKLEELKQQQQQSQQNKSDQNKQDQQKQDQQNQSGQQQKQDEQKQDQQQDQQQKDQQQQQQQAQQDQQKKQDQQQQQAAQQAQQEKEKQASAAQQQKEKEDKEKQDAAAYAAGQMTPEQAEQLLDAQKGDEKMLSLKQENKPLDRNKPIKDW